MSEVTLAAPITGWLMSVRDVPDPVFAEEMMGVGIAIDPTAGRVVAPCDAEVLLVAPTAHSVTLRCDGGAELLIHVGLETVALNGRGFAAQVRDGDRVAAGDVLISFDLDSVGLDAKSLASPIVLTNSDSFELSTLQLDRAVREGEAIGRIAPVDFQAEPKAAEGERESIECVVAFAHGLHARPAARIADAAKKHSSEVTISANGKTANGRSPVAIMALNVGHQDRVVVSAKGADRHAALRAVAAVLGAGEPATGETPLAARHGVAAADNEIVGLCAVPGVAAGNAVRWRREAAQVTEAGKGAELERDALEQAFLKTAADLRATAGDLDGPASEIAAAHAGLIEDQDLRTAAMVQIDEGRSAAYAWMSATSAAAEALGATGNPRMQERIADLRDVGEQIVRSILGEEGQAPASLPDNAVLLADDLLPSEVLSLDPTRLAAIVTERGGTTSHMAIIAGSLGVPTIVAIGPDLSRIEERARVLVDATSGKLVVNPTDELVERAVARWNASQGSSSSCATRDGEQVTLLANVGGVQEVERALAAGAAGCGLLRTEFLFLDRAEAPSVEEQRRAYQAVADALGDKPLTIRTLDIGGDKAVPFIDFGHEENPALGARGVRTTLVEPRLIDDQLSAIALVESDAVKVMVPMVSSVDEVRRVRDRLKDLSNGKPIKLGAMVETPAAALIAESLAKEADFLSIGTNDLAQYTLAMDRTNARVAPLIDALHPAVLRLIAMTAEAGMRSGITVSVCGNVASDPIGALLLVGFGIRELSGVPAAFPLVRQAIARVTAAQCRELAARALELESGVQVRALTADLLNEGAEG